LALGQQQRTIATACGWHTIQQNPLYPNDPNRLAGFFGSDNSALCGVPDYLNDLNAMQRAVLSQGAQFIAEFQEALDKLAISRKKMTVELLASDWAEIFLTVQRQGGN